MNEPERKNHWERIYETKAPEEVSWYQPTPETSLEFLQKSGLPLTARIIDVGGGDSFFVDHLLRLGYTAITVLDISEAAIRRAKERLGSKAEAVKWIVADAAEFEPETQYDFWHDRAAFHFLTNEDEISHYIAAAHKGLSPEGLLVIGTFSDQGPEKCSGLTIKQYSDQSMTRRLQPLFERTECITLNHRTPFNTLQHFVFCVFRKLN